MERERERDTKPREWERQSKEGGKKRRQSEPRWRGVDSVSGRGRGGPRGVHGGKGLRRRQRPEEADLGILIDEERFPVGVLWDDGEEVRMSPR
ncbi:hypothetical protein RJT34_17893 [Clitoria ternatea]|uniref:Uncharacterized protein n=1 Tax=Clitoria ternatea TaxID=43366 RepID=A0AAN9PFA6_CLITE